jgi:hypothetical protein
VIGPTSDMTAGKTKKKKSWETSTLLMKGASAPSHQPFSSSKHATGDRPQRAEFHGRVRSRGPRNLARQSLCQRESEASR